jgi:adenine/guanine phosphoribosyltransferase-like PRPP-binding protein
MTDPWQAFAAGASPAPWHDLYPAPMPDGRVLELPIRDYGDVGVTGLIANQASFPVVRALSGWMADAARALSPEVVLGLPTLGQVFAPQVAEMLGHTNWVPAGYTRKRWYEDALSVPISSSTGPGERRLWLDPRVAHRLRGRRVLLVDDVISTGSSAVAGLALLALLGIRPVALSVAMVQGDRWMGAWPEDVPVTAAFATPLLDRSIDGWLSRPGSCPLIVTP